MAQIEESLPVIVVGAGNAAMTAAISARQAGARVIVLEAAPEAEAGGNTRFTGALFRIPHEGTDDLLALVEPPELGDRRVVIDPYPPDVFHADLLTASARRADALATRVLVTESRATLEWMASVGVPFELTVGKLLDSSVGGGDYVLPPGGAVRVRGDGPELVRSLFQAAMDAGVEIRYESPVSGLIFEGSTVRGVRIRYEDSTEELLGTVILASGGFEANPEMRLRYLGEGWDLVKVRGTRFNSGGPLQRALEGGAAPWGHWGGCHASPVDAATPDVGDIALVDSLARYSYLYGILVNAEGRRFVDEGEDVVWRTYAKTGAAILSQPGAVAYQIFDAGSRDLLEPRYATGTPVEAGTIAELADALGIPAAVLQDTVDGYNAALQGGDFDPFAKDGVTTAGLEPPKTNWALPIATAPFIAYPVTCGITFTYGGLRTDVHARVLDTEGVPMPGLYATGEIVGGGFYFNYPAGSGLMRGAVFGRIAGENAATGEPSRPAPPREFADAQRGGTARTEATL